MTRPLITPVSDVPFHVSARCTNKDWFAIPMPWVWEIMELQLFFAVRAFDVRVHSFVLMSNHFHLLISSPHANLSQCMRYFMTETSRSLLRECRRINQIYGGRHRPTIIRSNHHFMNAYKYVYQNPLRAGLCSRVELYPYSTLPGLLGLQKTLIPTVEDTLLFGGCLEKHLSWLNEKASEENWDSVRRGLRRHEFELPKIDRKPNALEIDAL